MDLAATRDEGEGSQESYMSCYERRTVRLVRRPEIRHVRKTSAAGTSAAPAASRASPPPPPSWRRRRRWARPDAASGAASWKTRRCRGRPGEAAGSAGREPGPPRRAGNPKGKPRRRRRVGTEKDGWAGKLKNSCAVSGLSRFNSPVLPTPTPGPLRFLCSPGSTGFVFLRRRQRRRWRDPLRGRGKETGQSVERREVRIQTSYALLLANVI